MSLQQKKASHFRNERILVINSRMIDLFSDSEYYLQLQIHILILSLQIQSHPIYKVIPTHLPDKAAIIQKKSRTSTAILELVQENFKN